MEQKWLKLDFIGQCYYESVYLFYDEPLLFTCRDEYGAVYLVNAVDDNEWLMVGMTAKLIRRIEENKIALRDVFSNPKDGYVVRVIVDADAVRVEKIKPTLIPDDMLPEVGVALTSEVVVEDRTVVVCSENVKSRKVMLPILKAGKYLYNELCTKVAML